MQTRYIFCLFALNLLQVNASGESHNYDVVIYGGTSAGVIAAIQSQNLGHSVLLIEPTDRLGGLTSGGLGQTDIVNKAAIGGLSREGDPSVIEY